MSIEKEVFFAKPLYLVGFNKKKPLEWEAFSDPAGILWKPLNDCYIKLLSYFYKLGDKLGDIINTAIWLYLKNVSNHKDTHFHIYKSINNAKYYSEVNL